MDHIQQLASQRPKTTRTGKSTNKNKDTKKTMEAWKRIKGEEYRNQLRSKIEQGSHMPLDLNSDSKYCHEMAITTVTSMK